MTPTHVLKHNDGRMLAVVWPNKFDYESGPREEGITPYLNPEYYDACEQAIANGVPFKDQTDIQTLEAALNLSGKVSLNQPLEKMKPYPLPEGLELEIRIEDWKGSPIVEQKCQFAFIKKQPDSNDETQDDLWQESIKLWLHSETLDELKYRFRIERIKK